MDSRDIIDEFIESQGWDDDSVITLLCRYIDNQSDPDTFRDFLQQQKEMENSESELEKYVREGDADD